MIHDTPAAASGSGSKMLCADLSRDGTGSYSGAFSYLRDYYGAGYGKLKKKGSRGGKGKAKAGNMAKLSKPELATGVSFSGKGFQDGIYKAHLHEDTCANDGGGHYNGGDGVTVDAVNENWPTVTCRKGKCSGMAWNDWLLTTTKDFCNQGAIMQVLGGYPAQVQATCGALIAATAGGQVILGSDPRSADCFGAISEEDGTNPELMNCYWNDLADFTMAEWWYAANAVPAPTAGLSIVVHDTLAAASGSGSKMLCADLSVDGAGVYSGSFSYLQSYIDSASVGYGKVKKGSASLTEPRMATKVHFHGKDAEDDIYKAHLHDDTCENGGGGHYNGGDGVTVDAVNENWPEVTCMDGKCNGMAWSGWHPAAGDVFSIVVHDTPAAATGSGAKMLCADLMWDSKGQSYWGNFEYLQPYIDSAAPGVGAISHDSASLTAYNMGSSSGTGTGKGGKKGKGGGKKGKKAGLLAHQSQAATFGITAGGTIALVGVIGLVALVATKTLGAKPVPETEGLLEYIVPEAVEL